MQSLKLNFPSAKVKGCLYHFAQAIWRKIQSIGLQSSYTDDASYKKFFRKVISLAFIPHIYVQVVWRGLEAAAPQDNKVSAFSEYFKTTWLNGVYEIAEWNTYNEEGPRTNNHIEGWHNKVNRIIGKAHPNVFELVELFKMEQASTEVTLRQLAAGGLLPNPRKKYTIKERRILTIQEKFRNNDYNLDEYISALSCWVGI